MGEMGLVMSGSSLSILRVIQEPAGASGMENDDEIGVTLSLAVSTSSWTPSFEWDRKDVRWWFCARS